MCGRRETNSKLAIAKPPASIAPDIITVTDVIATLSRSNGNDQKKVDQVFQDAVDRGIVLRKDTLDSDWEVDLTGMTLPVARAACRFIFQRIRSAAQNGESLAEVTLITGVGRGQRVRSKDDGSPDSDGGRTGSNHDQRRFTNQGSTALREYVLQVLKEDFDPPLRGTVPKRAQGTVSIEKRHVEEWVTNQ
jgi:hypothetical protein